jgi:soluble lytic murein transglycosylase-like protein
LVSDLGRDALIATLEARVSPALVLAVISVESGGNKYALSPAGAMGVMQLMPDTAERFKVIDASDAFQNIQGGVRYLDFLLRKFDGDPILALAAYNAGEGAVERNKGVPPYKETRGYVPKVLAAWQVARMFCQTPPLAVTDPCAFSAVGDG